MQFADFFLTHDRWKAEHIKPYLSDIVVDTKDPDKLYLKYAKALTDKYGSWYTAMSWKRKHIVVPCSHILRHLFTRSN